MKFSNTVHQWFKTEWSGSLLLPDGWYGRPYDNQHMLTSVDESENSLIIVLDQKLKLHFEGLKLIKAYKNELVFGPYGKLRFDWSSYGGDGGSGTKEYESGKVKIVAVQGTLVNPTSQ